ncbi:MAG: DNA translocase FtsK 4TM domain-containing protein, partial [Sandaracinaceae bacterium]
MSLLSYDANGGENWIGPVGEGLASMLATAFGVAAWLVPAELALATARLFTKSTAMLGVGRVASTLVIVLIGCALVHLAWPAQTVFGGHLPGGLIGEVLGEVMRSLLGLAGSYLVGIAIILVTIVLRTPFSVIQSGRKLALAVRAAWGRLRDWARAGLEAWREAKELERLEREEAERAAQPKISMDATLSGGDALDSAPVVFADDEEPTPKRRQKKKKEPAAEPELDALAAEVESLDVDDDEPLEEPDGEEEIDEEPVPPPLPKSKRGKKEAGGPT